MGIVRKLTMSEFFNIMQQNSISVEKQFADYANMIQNRDARIRELNQRTLHLESLLSITTVERPIIAKAKSLPQFTLINETNDTVYTTKVMSPVPKSCSKNSEYSKWNDHKFLDESNRFGLPYSQKRITFAHSYNETDPFSLLLEQ